MVGVASPSHGSWAEYARADSRHLTRLPDDLGAVDAIGVQVNAQTAGFALQGSARLSPDDTVLVHAAAGGVGATAVRLAVAHGCRVVGAASADRLELVRRLGVHADRSIARSTRIPDLTVR